MTNVTVYDPAMCCSTGICGAEIDQRLVTFAADLDWLKTKGVAVTRINLSQEPQKFAENDAVKTVLETNGVEGLPVVMVGNAISASGRYPERGELAEFAGVECVPAAETSTPDRAKGCCGGGASADESSAGCC
jgi:hypothetical protein